MAICEPGTTAHATPTSRTQRLEVEVGKRPVAVVYKRTPRRSVFAVLCRDVRKLYVLEAADLSLVKVIELRVEAPSCIAASQNPRDACVWYCGGREYGIAASGVDLDRLEELGLQDGSTRRDVMDLAISADGGKAYLRGPGTPSGFVCARIDRPERPDVDVRLEELHREHRSTPPYLPDALGEFVAAGTAVYSADLKRQVAQLSVEPLLFLSGPPFCLARSGSALVAVSTNSWKQVGEALPAVFADAAPQAPQDKPEPTDHQGFGPRLRLFHDARRATVLICQGSEIRGLPLERLGWPDEVSLSLEIQSPALWHPGAPGRIELRRLDGRAGLELKQGPEGMTLEGDALVWAPKEGQIGPHKVILRSQAGGEERSHDLLLVVTRPCLDLGFAPSVYALSADGLYLAAHGGATGASPFAAAPGAGGGRLVSIDASALRVVADIQPAEAFGALAVDGRHVYCGLASADAIVALGREDLQPRQRLLTPGHVNEIHCLGADLLLALTTSGPCLYHRGERLAPLASPALEALAQLVRDPTEMKLHWATATQVALGPAVLDAELKSVLALVDPGRLVGNAPAKAEPTPTNPWGILVHHQGLGRPGGQVIAHLGGLLTAVAAHRPLAAHVCLSGDAVAGQGYTGAELQLRELVNGEVVASKLLCIDASDAQLSIASSFGVGTSIRIVGDVVATLLQQKCYILPLPAPQGEAFPPPLHMAFGGGVVMLGPGDILDLETGLLGGAAPVQYRLIEPLPGVHLDGDTGTVMLDGRALIEWSLERLRAELRRSGEDGAAFQDALASYVRTAGGALQTLVGRPLRGLPYALRIGVRALDANGQMIDRYPVVVLELPPDRLQPGAEDQGGRPDTHDARIAELERQVAELMRALQQLRQGGAGTPPQALPQPDEPRHPEPPPEVAKAMTAIRALLNACQMYRSNTGRWPTTLDDLLVDPGILGWGPEPYLDVDELPKDPWGNAYEYHQSGARISITSLGADGRPGGLGPAADIDSDLLQQRR